ncbi:MAG: hypothetical protein ACK5Q5_00665 [Planctomycetaceae bacterium]
MLLEEPRTLYRLSRSDLVRQRALRRIVRTEELLMRMLGVELFDSERRREPRQAIQTPINLCPVQVKGLSILATDDAPPFLAFTSNISLNGLGFVHDEPWRCNLFLAEFDVSELEPLRLLVKLRWTTRPQPHAYRSGGRVLGVARRPTPSAASDD